MSIGKSNSFSGLRRYFVKNPWRYVSNLGIGYSEKLLVIKSNTIVNQINFVLAGTMGVLLIILVVRLQIIDKPLNIGVTRVFYTFLLCILNLLLALFSLRNLSKYSLIFISPLVFMVIPALAGFVEDVGYFYNGYVLVAASVIPQLILSPVRNKKIYWASMIYYLLLIIFIDKISNRFQKEASVIFEHLREMYFIDKLAQIFVFLFINTIIYYLRRENLRFEDRLRVKNHVLNIQNCRICSNREEILEQKQLIEEKNRSITDSINYASFIQSSILPKSDQLDSCMDDYFILFKPVEIVSGDFYWASKIRDKTIITVADCTGHGVPGAFMSMLGITLLDEIVNKGSITNPGIILDRLRKEVVNSLNQKGGFTEVKDGMDIVMCVLDRKNRKLQFAGANRSLYLIRENGLNNPGITHAESNYNETLIEIKGDPMPVGISYAMTNFTLNEIDIYEGDTFYLFTDGFPDQFGGANNKKFSYRQLREQLIITKTERMNDQAEKLDKVLSDWRGSNDQTDDILICGFRINSFS